MRSSARRFTSSRREVAGPVKVQGPLDRNRVDAQAFAHGRRLPCPRFFRVRRDTGPDRSCRQRRVHALRPPQSRDRWRRVGRRRGGRGRRDHRVGRAVRRHHHTLRRARADFVPLCARRHPRRRGLRRRAPVGAGPRRRGDLEGRARRHRNRPHRRVARVARLPPSRSRRCCRHRTARRARQRPSLPRDRRHARRRTGGRTLAERRDRAPRPHRDAAGRKDHHHPAGRIPLRGPRAGPLSLRRRHDRRERPYGPARPRRHKVEQGHPEPHPRGPRFRDAGDGEARPHRRPERLRAGPIRFS